MKKTSRAEETKKKLVSYIARRKVRLRQTPQIEMLPTQQKNSHVGYGKSGNLNEAASEAKFMAPWFLCYVLFI